MVNPEIYEKYIRLLCAVNGTEFVEGMLKHIYSINSNASLEWKNDQPVYTRYVGDEPVESSTGYEALLDFENLFERQATPELGLEVLLDSQDPPTKHAISTPQARRGEQDT